MDLEKIIELAKIIARPYKITTYVLAVLLIISLLGNIYLATQEVQVVLEADNNNESNVTQNQG